eukprot:1031568_1
MEACILVMMWMAWSLCPILMWAIIGSPTPAPTADPTPAPTTDPTPAPTAFPSPNPTRAPTAPPTKEAPSGSVSTASQVTSTYFVEIELCDEDCAFYEHDITSRIVNTLSEFETTVSDVETVGDTVLMTVKITTDRDHVLSNNDLKDEIEGEMEGDYPDVDVEVSRHEGSGQV